MTSKEELLLFLAKHYDDKHVEKIANYQDDDDLYSWVLSLLRENHNLYQYVRKFVNDFEKDNWNKEQHNEN